MRLAVLLLSLVSMCECGSVYIYVSPYGSDSNSGLDVSYPIATLEKAKQLLDEPGITGNTVFVELMGGYFNLPSTLHFTHGYTQTVTFRAYKDQEVHVTGGIQIPSSLFTMVTDSEVLDIIPQVAWSKVRQVNLYDIGITNFGNISDRAWLEIFINGNPGRLAQYPNERFINIDAVPGGRYGTTLIYNTTHDFKWVLEKDPWADGFWYVSWGDEAIKISHIDPYIHEIKLTKQPHYGLRVGHYNDPILPGYDKQGGYFRVFNMLTELDQPGEYYLDRSTGILYIWPNTKTGSLVPTDIITVSLVNDCISMDPGVRNLVFKGFTLEACRGKGFAGDKVQDITIQNMEMKNLGAFAVNFSGYENVTYGVNVSGSNQITVSACNIYNTNGGVAVSGGDRWTLTPSGNVIEDNHIWKFARVGSGYTAATIGGVGNTVRYNLMHDGQYIGMRYYGNDNIMEYNHIHHMCVNCTDCGAIYAGRDWTMRGNVIRYNYIHDVLRLTPGTDCRGVMLDDQASSVNIEHNIFDNNFLHINIGGGRDNIVRNNSFYSTSFGSSMRVDGRGLISKDDQLWQRLKAVPYKSKIWAAKYPKLAIIDSNDPMAPMGNQIYDNVYTNTKISEIPNYGLNKTEYFDIHDNHRIMSWKAAAGTFLKSVSRPMSIDSVGPRRPTGPKYTHRFTFK